MIVGMVASLEYISNPSRSELYVADANKVVEFVRASQADGRYGNFKAVVAPNEETLVRIVSRQLMDTLMNYGDWGRLDPTDFRFEVSFERVNVEGEFWLIPSSGYGISYEINP